MKKLIVIGLAISLLGVTSLAFAKKYNCKVESVEGETVILNCGDEAANLQPGEKVEFGKDKKSKKQYEGC